MKVIQAEFGFQSGIIFHLKGKISAGRNFHEIREKRKNLGIYFIE